MGPGPNYLLYRPYHLTSLETPITIFNACINKEATIAPTEGIVAETITVAKKDLKAGDRLDGIGGYTIYGRIEEYKVAKEQNLVPIGLIDKDTKVIRDINRGQPITYDVVEINEESKIYKLRTLQDKTMG